MVPLDRTMPSSYRLSIVTMSSAAVCSATIRNGNVIQVTVPDNSQWLLTY